MPIIIEEVKDAIDNQIPGKWLLSGGLTTAYYKLYKYDLSLVYSKMYNEIYGIKTLPPPYAASRTFLIPKTDEIENLKSVKPYGPIYLTNVGYKS